MGFFILNQILRKKTVLKKPMKLVKNLIFTDKVTAAANTACEKP